MHRRLQAKSFCPHRVVARARRLELRRTVKVQPMALHDSLFHMISDVAKRHFLTVSDHVRLKLGRLRAKKGPAPPPPLGNFADISYLEENFKPHLLRDVCTLCSGALVSDSLLHMLL